MPDIEKLIAEWEATKRAEGSLKAERQRLAREIAAALDHPPEGSKTHEVGSYRVTVKGMINRKVNWALFDEVTMGNAGEHPPCIAKRTLDIQGMRWLEENDRDTWVQYAQAVTSTPGAPQVTVKPNA